MKETKQYHVAVSVYGTLTKKLILQLVSGILQRQRKKRLLQSYVII